MHVGQVYSGVVGVTHPQYEVFGDVVSVAMKLEASALANTIHMSTLMRDNLEENWSGALARSLAVLAVLARSMGLLWMARGVRRVP